LADFTQSGKAIGAGGAATFGKACGTQPSLSDFKSRILRGNLPE
jgi:hypothetical protein